MAVNGFINHSINGPTGSIYGHINGSINGDVLGDIYGQVNGNIKGDVKGNIYGSVNGNVEGLVYGKIIGQVNGNYRSANNLNNSFIPQINFLMNFNYMNFMVPKKLVDNPLISCSTNIRPIQSYSISNKQNTSLDSKCGFIASNNESFADCPICLRNLNEIKYSGEQLISSQCGHVICYCCFDKIFEKKSQINCPCCGLEQNKSKYHRIFL